MHFRLPVQVSVLLFEVGALPIVRKLSRSSTFEVLSVEHATGGIGACGEGGRLVHIHVIVGGGGSGLPIDLRAVRAMNLQIKVGWKISQRNVPIRSTIIKFLAVGRTSVRPIERQQILLIDATEFNASRVELARVTSRNDKTTSLAIEVAEKIAHVGAPIIGGNGN